MSSWLTIDRKYREVGAADQARQQGHAVLDAAVMMEECAAGAFHQGLELRHLIGSAADIEHLRAAEVGRGGRVLPEPAVVLDVDEREFAAHVLAFPRGVLPGSLGLRLREGRRFQAAFETLAVRDLAAQSPVEIDQRVPDRAKVVVLMPCPGRRLRQGPAQGLV